MSTPNHRTGSVFGLRLARLTVGLAMALAGSLMTGCEVDSFMDPSKTGRFEFEPTTIPVLERIDVIEQQRDYWTKAAAPTPDDLVPSDLSYTLFPGDTVTLGIYELYQQGMWSTNTRRIDAGGYYRVPEIGDIRAAGMTAQQFEDEVKRQATGKIFVTAPQVDVVVEQGGGLRYTVYGYVKNEGQFNLQNPDLRVIEALANAGGVPQTTEHVYIVRQVYLTDEAMTSFDPRSSESRDKPTTRPADSKPATNVEDLINQLDNKKEPTVPPVSPGMLRQDETRKPPVDITDLEPVKVTQEPPVDVDALKKGKPANDGSGDSFIYVEEKGEWVRVPGKPGADNPPPSAPADAQRPMVTARIIDIDYKALAHGDMSLNVVIRPNDLIYVDGPEQGLVYIEGEINRPGVYQLPTTGQLTLSRLVAASGGLGAIAMPTRVDLTRKVGPYKEATIRLDLAAIRQRTEPDVVIRPDDHIIIGTSWVATPLAILRNGLRATYGFGFLLDQNFAEDVFGVTQGTAGN